MSIVSQEPESWMFIHSASEIAEIVKYSFDSNDKKSFDGRQRCPACQHGRLVLKQYSSPVGAGLGIGCKFGDADCTYEVDITDYGAW